MRELCMRDKTELISAVYDTINDIGKHKIRSDVISNVELADEYIRYLFDRVSEHFGTRLDADSMITIYEILLHFMLTACTIPSQRKVKLSHLTIDLVIPSLHTLSRSPGDVILVQFIRSYEDLAKIDKILSLFELKAEELNIWLITSLNLHVKYSINVINLAGLELGRMHVIKDIDAFLKERRDKSFRLVHF